LIDKGKDKSGIGFILGVGDEGRGNGFFLILEWLRLFRENGVQLQQMDFFFTMTEREREHSFRSARVV